MHRTRLIASTLFALTACHARAPAPPATNRSPAAPPPPPIVLPVVEPHSTAARCPSVVATVALGPEHGFVGRLELTACPMPDGGAFDPTATETPTARVQLFDARGTLADTMPLASDRAALEIVDAYGDGRPMFIATVDLSCGMGSYCGPRAQFFEVAGAKLRTVTLAETDAGERKLWLIRSPKNAWKLAPARSGHGLDVLATSTYPDLDAHEAFPRDASPGFVTSIRRYAYEGGRWHVHERVVPPDGLSNDGDDWPKESAFP